MGQDPTAKGGPVELMKDVKDLVPIWDEGPPKRPVGLQTPGGEVRVMGASAWMLREKLSKADKLEYETIITARAKAETGVLSRDSTGVIWGLEMVGDNPAVANEKLAAEQAAEAAAKLADESGKTEDDATRAPARV